MDEYVPYALSTLLSKQPLPTKKKKSKKSTLNIENGIIQFFLQKIFLFTDLSAQKRSKENIEDLGESTQKKEAKSG